jgi:DNA-binding CsgD family transcriptional regulator
MPRLPLPPLDTPGLCASELRTLELAYGFRNKEVAIQLCISEATVYKQIQNARIKYRDHLDRLAMQDLLKGAPYLGHTPARATSRFR